MNLRVTGHISECRIHYGEPCDCAPFRAEAMRRLSTPRPRHDCAQVERDNLDLHKALAEAIRLLGAANHELNDACAWGVPNEVVPLVSYVHLVEVLDRTSRPLAVCRADRMQTASVSRDRETSR